MANNDNNISYVGAPYNFIPLPNKVVERYKSVDELPSHAVIDDKLNTGCIEYSIKAETPIFVGGGKQSGNEFYRNPNGDYAIPGSTIKGLVRNNMHILGMSAYLKDEDYEDYRLMFREVAGGPLSEDYEEILGIKTKSSYGSSFSNPQNVKAGYLIKDGKRYSIAGTVIEKGEYYRVPRSIEFAEPWANRFAFSEEVFYLLDDEKNAITDLKPIEDNVSDDYFRGYILGSGKMDGQNSLYVIPQINRDNVVAEIPDEDRISYEEDYRIKENQLGEHKEFFSLMPDGLDIRPVFYIQLDGKVYWGVTRFLRVFYNNSIANGVFAVHKKLDGEVVLDYPHSMLGCSFVNGDNNFAYKSRIDFEDAKAKEGVQSKKTAAVILGQPHLSNFYDYLRQGDKVYSYQNADFKLRGSKQYWFKENVDPNTSSEKNNVIKRMDTLPANTMFNGKLHFKNLTDDELGLLLWTLKLDDGCKQAIGMGKPYGYGRVSIEIKNVVRYKNKDMYSAEGLLGGICAEEKIATDEYIKKYKQYLKDSKGIAIDNQEWVKDFMFIHKTIRKNSETRYMNLDNKEFTKRKNYPVRTIETIAEYREKHEDGATNKEASMDDLLKKFGKHHKK